MKKTIFLAFVVLLAGCTDPDAAKKALEGAGYTDIKITGYSWLSCSKDDTTSTGFKAKGPSGKNVEGAVCGGLLFKNSTIRSN